MFNNNELKKLLTNNGRTLVYTANGKITATLPLTDEQIVGSFELFIEMLERSGYSVTKK